MCFEGLPDSVNIHVLTWSQSVTDRRGGHFGGPSSALERMLWPGSTRNLEWHGALGEIGEMCREIASCGVGHRESQNLAKSTGDNSTCMGMVMYGVIGVCTDQLGPVGIVQLIRLGNTQPNWASQTRVRPASRSDTCFQGTSWSDPAFPNAVVFGRISERIIHS